MMPAGGHAAVQGIATMKRALCVVLFLGMTACSYREAPKTLTFQGREYKLGESGNFTFVDRNFYFLPGENNTNRTNSVDYSRVLDKKRSQQELHNILVAGLRKATKVIHEREDGTRWCVVYEERDRFFVTYHVTGEYKNGFWCLDHSRVLEKPWANEGACDNAAAIWAELGATGLAVAK
jgi:hypothetical protein